MLSSERTKTKPNSQSKLKPQSRNGESDLDKKKCPQWHCSRWQLLAPLSQLSERRQFPAAPLSRERTIDFVSGKEKARRAGLG